MGERFGVSQIVNRNEVDVWITKCRAKNVSADTAKAVDTNLNCHVFKSS